MTYASAFAALRQDLANPRPALKPAVPKPQAGPPIDATAEWRRGIFALPEAVDRPGAVARVLAAHNERSMPLARVRSFLAALPKETPKEMGANSGTVSLKDRAELALNAARGKPGQTWRFRADAIEGALRLHAERGTDLARALELHRIDPRTL
jgi:hypothetical protein